MAATPDDGGHGINWAGHVVFSSRRYFAGYGSYSGAVGGTAGAAGVQRPLVQRMGKRLRHLLKKERSNSTAEGHYEELIMNYN